MKDQRCTHRHHHTESVPYYVKQGMTGCPVLKGWDFVTRTWQICDDGLAGVPLSPQERHDNTSKIERIIRSLISRGAFLE